MCITCFCGGLGCRFASADAAQGVQGERLVPADCPRGASGCCAGVRCADTSKPPPVMPTACAHKGMRASACVGGCCAGSKRMARGGPASCLRGQRTTWRVPADVAPRDDGCCAGGRWMVARRAVDGCYAGSKRMARGGRASCQQKVRRDYIWLARVIAHFGKRAIHQVKRVCSP